MVELRNSSGAKICQCKIAGNRLALRENEKAGVGDIKLDDVHLLTAKFVNSTWRTWAAPERANNFLYFAMHHDYSKLIRGARMRTTPE